jgi:hypothetical protein
MQRLVRTLNESEAPPDTFHDCHIHGVRWNRDRFTLSLYMQYIIEWIYPTNTHSAFQFLLCEARLIFSSVSELIVTMDWSGSALDCEIGSLCILNSRKTPNGETERHFEIDFADPDGIMSLWSTGYKINLLGEPVIASAPSMPTDDDD